MVVRRWHVSHAILCGLWLFSIEKIASAQVYISKAPDAGKCVWGKHELISGGHRWKWLTILSTYNKDISLWSKRHNIWHDQLHYFFEPIEQDFYFWFSYSTTYRRLRIMLILHPRAGDTNRSLSFTKLLQKFLTHSNFDILLICLLFMLERFVDFEDCWFQIYGTAYY